MLELRLWDYWWRLMFVPLMSSIVWLVARVNCAVYDFPEDSPRRLEPVDVSSGLLKAG